MHNEFKTLGFVIKYMEKKINEDEKINRLMRYLTPNPYEEESLTYDDDNPTKLKQPKLVKSLLKTYGEYNKVLYSRDNNMEQFKLEENPYMFIHPLYIYCSTNNSNKGSYLIRCAITCSAKQREVYDENALPCDRILELAQCIDDLFRDKGIEDENYAKLIGTGIKFQISSNGIPIERYNKTTDVSVCALTFKVTFVDNDAINVRRDFDD